MINGEWFTVWKITGVILVGSLFKISTPVAPFSNAWQGSRNKIITEVAWMID